jgi:phosphatidylinositol alpha-1,6-mannosyltransferase
VPPGVDPIQFRPFDDEERQLARSRFGLGQDQFVVASVNRLVARKGLDVLIRASTVLAREGMDIRVMIGGVGRQHEKLARLIGELDAPVELLGRLSTEDVGRLYGAADAMAMLCHQRWLGLEQEGFGIVFLEAAAAGIPQVAGRSGGAHEAVEDGVTGLVIDQPRDHLAVAQALRSLEADAGWRHKLGQSARSRVCSEFDYDLLAMDLQAALDRELSAPPPRRRAVRASEAALANGLPAEGDQRSSGRQGSDNLNSGA